MEKNKVRMVEVSDLVGLIEIAERLGVERATVRQWRYRGWMDVEPVAVVSAMPIFSWKEVQHWAEESKVAEPRYRKP